MKQLPITAVVVSVEISDKVYGTGNTHFVSLRAEEDRNEETGEDAEVMGLADALDQSLDMHLRCWESALAAKFASGHVSAADTGALIQRFMTRIGRMRRYLNEDEPLVRKKETTE